MYLRGFKNCPPKNVFQVIFVKKLTNDNNNNNFPAQGIKKLGSRVPNPGGDLDPKER